jgi:hypothetical protein
VIDGAPRPLVLSVNERVRWLLLLLMLLLLLLLLLLRAVVRGCYEG